MRVFGKQNPILALAAVLLVIPAGGPAAPVPADRTSEKTKELMKQRREAALQEWEARENEYKDGRAMLSDGLVETSRRLRRAESEMATTRTARINAHQGHRDRVKKLFDLNTARWNAGRIGIADLKQSEYHYLEAEIELEREKAR